MEWKIFCFTDEHIIASGYNTKYIENIYRRMIGLWFFMKLFRKGACLNEKMLTKNENSRYFKGVKMMIIGLAVGMANGLFGSGGGTIAVPAMVLFLDAEEHQAHATAISIILPLTLVSAFLYISGSFVDWPATLKVTAGGMAGGYIGARLLKICPASLLRKIFAFFMILGAIRMLFS